jgi:hypothetical protein
MVRSIQPTRIPMDPTIPIGSIPYWLIALLCVIAASLTIMVLMKLCKHRTRPTEHHAPIPGPVPSLHRNTTEDRGDAALATLTARRRDFKIK